MKEEWKGKNIDLHTMSERIALFFSERGFSTTASQNEDKTVITAVPKSSHGIETIQVEILGKPEDFSVKFVSGMHARALIRYGSFASLMTGGYFFLRGLKSQEDLEKLEKRFWIYVDETVWFLSSQRNP